MSVLLPFGGESRDGETRGFIVGPGYYWSVLVLVLQLLGVWVCVLLLLVMIPNRAMDDGCKGGRGCQ